MQNDFDDILFDDTAFEASAIFSASDLDASACLLPPAAYTLVARMMANIPSTEVKLEALEPSAAAAKPTPKRAPAVHKAAVSDMEGDCLSKWKRRDVAKHLAGERSRRAKRMGKVHALRAILEGLSGKPTVNQILSAAIEQIRAIKDGASTASTPVPSFAEAATSSSDAASFHRDCLRSSPTSMHLVLDENHCIVEASQGMLAALRWPSGEESIIGQYIASVMHPEDASALVSEAVNFRSSSAGGEASFVRPSVSFMGFEAMAGYAGTGVCAFPKEYMVPVMVEASISNGNMFLNVPH